MTVIPDDHPVGFDDNRLLCTVASPHGSLVERPLVTRARHSDRDVGLLEPEQRPPSAWWQTHAGDGRSSLRSLIRSSARSITAIIIYLTFQPRAANRATALLSATPKALTYIE
jgi:hypothetical protein